MSHYIYISILHHDTVNPHTASIACYKMEHLGREQNAHVLRILPHLLLQTAITSLVRSILPVIKSMIHYKQRNWAWLLLPANILNSMKQAWRNVFAINGKHNINIYIYQILLFISITNSTICDYYMFKNNVQFFFCVSVYTFIYIHIYI